jgi:large subunit ribosomal protein L6
MSRLGKKPLVLPEKVKAELKENVLKITGPLGNLSREIPERLKAKIENNSILVEKTESTTEADMLQGLVRGLIKNDIEGVVKGYKKDLEMSGLGYKASVEGKNLNLLLGFSHPVTVSIPDTIKITVDKATKISVSGVNKNLVGEIAAKIRSYRPPEPYKGTGIKYVGEHIIRKAGKAAAGAIGGGK